MDHPTQFLRSPRHAMKMAKADLEAGAILHDNEGRRVLRIGHVMAAHGARQLKVRYKTEEGWVTQAIGEKFKSTLGVGWISANTILFQANYREGTYAIGCGPYFVTPDNQIELPTGARKIHGYSIRKNEVFVMISERFNGGTTLTEDRKKKPRTEWVRGYDCHNIPPPGYRLYTSWSSSYSWMRYVLDPIPQPEPVPVMA